MVYFYKCNTVSNSIKKLFYLFQIRLNNKSIFFAFHKEPEFKQKNVHHLKQKEASSKYLNYLLTSYGNPC